MKKKAKYLLPETKELVCPLCKKKTQPEQTRLPKIKTWMQTIGGWNTYDIIEEARTRNFNDWACLSCESNGHTIVPDYTKQNYGYGGPILMYVDKDLNCETCKKEFTFSAKEQKFWYEDLHFNYCAYPKSCASCRKKIREPRILNTKLGGIVEFERRKPRNINCHCRYIYTKLGIQTKAEIFYARAKNKKNGKRKIEE